MAALRKTLGIVVAACAAATLLVGAELAGNPNNPGTGGTQPGHGGTPPGQAKKGTNVKDKAQHGKALGKAKKGTHPSHPAHPSHPVTPAQPSHGQSVFGARGCGRTSATGSWDLRMPPPACFWRRGSWAQAVACPPSRSWSRARRPR